ncbi:MAG: helicase HerA domain-containing protein [Vampirovibrionales bacterium]
MMFNFLKAKLGVQPNRTLQVSKDFAVPLSDFASTGERDAILASSGMGKSYLTGVLLEETLENGITVCIIDPEGEHFTLAERYPCMIIGGDHGHVPFDPAGIDLYTEAMCSTGLSTVFDLSEYIDAEQQAYYGLIGDSLFRMEQKYRRKIRLVVEEAQIYAPQSGGTGTSKKKQAGLDCITVSQRIAKRGRKRALDSLWATQRPASLSKDILSQCNRFWFGGITSELDFKAIRPFLQQAGISFEDIKALKPGEFIYYARGITKKIKVRKRYCKHAGSTPETGMNFQPATDKALDAVLGQLSKQIEQKAAELREEQSEINRLKEQIRKLEKQNESLRNELEHERMATKVIHRLGGMDDKGTNIAMLPGIGIVDTYDEASEMGLKGKKTRRKKAGLAEDGTQDSGHVAKPASGVTSRKLQEPEVLNLSSLEG